MPTEVAKTPIRCFLLTPTGRTRRSMRRFSVDSEAKIACGDLNYHNASIAIDVVEGSYPVYDLDGYPESGRAWPRDDPRWPVQCERCGYAFADTDPRQVFSESLWKRSDTGEEISLRDAPPGAMYYATWLDDCKWAVGPDGRALMVVCPDGYVWHVDGEASNCTRKGDHSHKCWVRHGTPPDVHVDKNGVTCNAGAGSIAAPRWRGFLTNGVLQDHR